jgi:hypothetical protein
MHMKMWKIQSTPVYLGHLVGKTFCCQIEFWKMHLRQLKYLAHWELEEHLNS